MGRRPARHDHPWRLRDAAVAIAVFLVSGLAGGCSALGDGPKPASEAQASADPLVALRQDLDRLRGDLGELRTQVETVQRTGTEHVDRAAQETRAEFDAVQRAMEASARNDLQRQVEVLDAQSRRIDLLERRAAELGQALRRIELGFSSLESQLARVLDGTPGATAPRSRGGAAARAPAAGSGPRPAAEPEPSGTPSDGAAAGAGLTPPAMPGSSRSPGSGTPAAPPAPERDAKAETAERPRPEAPPPATKRSDGTPRETKTAPPVRPASEGAGRAATAPPTPSETKAPAPARGAGGTPPREAKASPPPAPAPAGALSARALFDRGMDNWSKGEPGQAVLDFEELVQGFPSDPLAASAQFRIGEAYYLARDFDRAAMEYRKAVELAPKGKDTPQALLRLGLAYRAQKRESDARQAWSQLKRDFPESDATEEARRALRGR
jgi:TolA-binding protein